MERMVLISRTTDAHTHTATTWNVLFFVFFFVGFSDDDDVAYEMRFRAKYHIFHIRHRFTVAAWTHYLSKEPSLGIFILQLAFAVRYAFPTATKSEGTVDTVRARECQTFLLFDQRLWSLASQPRIGVVRIDYTFDVLWTCFFKTRPAFQPFGVCFSIFRKASWKLWKLKTGHIVFCCFIENWNKNGVSALKFDQSVDFRRKQPSRSWFRPPWRTSIESLKGRMR